MRRFLLPTTIALLGAHTASATLLLNEIYVDPYGNTTADDNREFVEILSTSGSDSLNDVWLLEIEGDGATPTGPAGRIDAALNLTGLSLVNGLLTLGDGYGTSNPWGLTTNDTTLADLARPSSVFLENGAVTFMLVTGFTGNVYDGTAPNSDIDADNDRVIDGIFWTAILDSISNRDGATTGDLQYGPDLMDGLGFTPIGLDAFARLSTDVTRSNQVAWSGGQVDATQALTATVRNLPSGATLTPGAPNYPLAVPEPTSFALVGLGLLALRARRAV